MVQLVDADSNEVVLGYTFVECELMSGDSTRHLVRWNGNSALPIARRVRIVFHFENCELYSFKAVQTIESD